MENEGMIIELLERILDKLDDIWRTSLDTASNTSSIESNTSNVESSLNDIEQEVKRIKNRM